MGFLFWLLNGFLIFIRTQVIHGICGALLARKVNPFEAACAACYINGRAGDLAAKKFGEGLMASDLINEIPNVIKLK